MTTTRLFTVQGSSVANGASDELTESDNEDFIIEKVKVIDEENNLGDDSDVTIQIGGNSITDQVVPLVELTQDHSDLPVLNLNWPSNKQLRFSYTNDSGGSITLKFVVYVREAGSATENTQPGEVLGTPMGMR